MCECKKTEALSLRWSQIDEQKIQSQNHHLVVTDFGRNRECGRVDLEKMALLRNELKTLESSARTESQNIKNEFE